MKSIFMICIIVYQVFYAYSVCSASNFEVLKEAAIQGNVKAQFYLGIMYAEGREVNQSYDMARKWWEKAAEQGDAEAQFCLGNVYEHGLGVHQDYTRAYHLYKKSAEQGHIRAISV